MSTVLVTGASGFIGRFLVRDLLREGHEVIALMRRPQEQLAALRLWLQGYGLSTTCLSAQAYDLQQAPSAILGQGRPIAAVYHCAAVFAFGQTRQALWQPNVGAALAWADWAAARPERPRLVHISGYMLPLTTLAELAARGVHAQAPDSAWEAAARRWGAYEMSKAEAHLKLRARASALGVDLSVVHPATVVADSERGEAELNSGFGQLVADVAAGRFSLMPGGAGHWLPLVSMDVVSGFMARLLRLPDSAGQDYLLLDPATPQLPELLGLLSVAVGQPAPRLSLPVAWMQALLRIPGLATAMGVYPEALHFVRPHRAPALGREQAALQALELAHPDIRALLAASLPGLRQALAKEQLAPVSA